LLEEGKEITAEEMLLTKIVRFNIGIWSFGTANADLSMIKATIHLL
jgi:hypothetical protein